ncbi:MAG: 16S rRNA (adenine(1518)-N(6)/adenine(1519)-N(6))-dimethyltransferase RsmA [Algiphilus sp.]
MTTERVRADKRFGQNYLHDRRVVDRIIRAIAPREGDRIVEIGPGEGALTGALIDSGAMVTAIELDDRLLPGLQARFADRFTLLHQDALRVDLNALADDSDRIRLVGNLPYNISTPLLFHVLRFAHRIDDMHFMLQKEVVDRMGADVGSKQYGRLTVALAAHTAVEPLFDVAPGAFRPAPKVTSTVVRLRPRSPQPALLAPQALDRLLRAGFSKRRKTLANALSGVCPRTLLSACGIDPQARAETVTPAAWIGLANALGAATIPEDLERTTTSGTIGEP